jgi:hypothetical protein
LNAAPAAKRKQFDEMLTDSCKRECWRSFAADPRRNLPPFLPSKLAGKLRSELLSRPAQLAAIWRTAETEACCTAGCDRPMRRTSCRLYFVSQRGIAGLSLAALRRSLPFTSHLARAQNPRPAAQEQPTIALAAQQGALLCGCKNVNPAQQGALLCG